jgi:NADH dehydrogenase
VNNTLEHPGFSDVFIAGDAAQLQTPISKQAYHALDMGRSVANTLTRMLDGKRGRRYRPAAKPTLLAFGDLDTVISTPQVSLAGPSLAAGKEAVFAAVMAQLDQRSAKDRLDAALVRGRQATRELLWPGLNNWPSLRRQARVKKL